MKLYYFFACLLYFSHPTFASENLRYPLSTLERLNKQSYLPVQKKQCYEGESGSNSASETLAHQCAVDICGTPEEGKVPSTDLLDSNFDQYVQADAMQRFSEIENKLEEMIDSHLAQNDAFIKST